MLTDILRLWSAATADKPVFTKFAKLSSAILLAALAAGCVSSALDVDTKGIQPISAKLVAEMKRKGMTPASPVLVRIFKEESELEIWKRDGNGKYALLKTYPMCRWSGQLGPKKRIGDRQAPEGFYHVSADRLNPNSQYYLSFNLGYPNKLESALGYSGEALMVHGACSSSGCYALTDEGVAEIYAVAREALKGGQTSFQVQAFPFRMTAQKMARNRNNPNYGFWTDLKKGYDSFEVTRRQPKVAYCDKRYVFDTEFSGGDPLDPLAACPPAISSGDPLVAARTERDLSTAETMASTMTGAAVHAYSDGGMHPTFRKLLAASGDKALSKRTSLTKVPISRPDAALADPYSASE